MCLTHSILFGMEIFVFGVFRIFGEKCGLIRPQRHKQNPTKAGNNVEHIMNTSDAISNGGLSDRDHNSRVYLASTLLTNLTGAFGDPSVLLPALALRLDAPSWLVALPLATQMCVAYLPVLFLGWFMRPEWSRKRLYACSCLAMTLTLAPLIVALFAGTGRNQLLSTLAVSWLLFGLAQGVGILPWWGLFALMFPPGRRGWMLGLANAIGATVTLAASGVAAWLISARSPLAFPFNFAVSLSVYALGAITYSFFILRLREPPPETIAAPRPPLRDYGAQLRAVIFRDRAFGRTLAAAAVGAALVAIAPLFLAFAQKHRGFTPGATSALVFLRQLAVIPTALLAGRISSRVHPNYVVSGIMAAVAAGAFAAPWLRGNWQFFPLLLTGLSPLTYHFCLVSLMSHAPTTLTHRYLTVYYMAAIIPGFTPMLLGVLLDRKPLTALAAAAALAVITAFVFWRAGKARFPA